MSFPAPIPVTQDRANLVDLIDTGLVYLDDHGHVLLINLAAEQGFEISRDRATGQKLGDLSVVTGELQTVLDQSQSGVTRLHDLDLPGGKYDCTLHTDEQGYRLLEFHSLDFENKRLRLQQREVQTGLLELLSRNLGHEIRNPLGGIRGASQMLANELESPDLITLARLIMREADRIDELIRSFGQPQLASNDVDIYPLIDEVLALMRVEFGSFPELERDYDPSIPLIKGDGPAIRQVLLNLIRNACQSGANWIRIKTRVEHGGALLQNISNSVLRIDLIDNGEGVPDSLRNLLFLPLVTGKRNGTGLGLALSQKIAAAHDGILTYEPLQKDQGSGSCFSLYLPLERIDRSEASQELR